MKSKSWWRAVFCGAMLALGLAASGNAADTTPSAPTPGASAGPASSGNTANAAQERQARQPRDAVCTKCHDESETKPILSIYQTPHGAIGDARTPACQDCHGESTNHMTSTGKRPPPDRVFGTKRSPAGFAPISAQEQSETCLSCHKGGMRTLWPGSQHASNDIACTSCHVIHNPIDKVRVKELQPDVCFQCHREKRAEIKKTSAHPIEVGKMACSDCHNPHGSSGPRLLKKNSVNETCWECHADKRGPFLWEHQPAVEDCTNCHNPHGSNVAPLLKARPPFLCQECHDGPHFSPTPYGAAAGGIQSGGTAGRTSAPAVQGSARACMNCHVMVHGSNSPAGAFLNR